MTVRLSAFLLLLTAVAACSSPEADPAQTALVGEADVATVQARVFEATQAIDANIASVETEAAAADSVRQLAYTPVLERLRRDRSRLQIRVDSLAPLPRAAFDTTTTAIAAQIQRLRSSVARARFDAATDAATLQAAAAQRLGRFDTRIASARAAAASDTTGRRGALLDSLTADRARLDARLAAFADTTAPAFTRLRQQTARATAALEQRLDRLAPDSSAVRRP